VRLYVIQDREERPLAWASSQDAARQLVQDQGGTEAGARWVQVDVPTDKAGLLEWLNRHGTTSGPLGGETPAAAPEQPAAQISGERILETSGHDFAVLLEAAIERLGELRDAGWKALRSLHPRRGQSPSMERGLRFLTLAQVAELEEAR
jgi:hypothetical protein